IEHQHHPEIKFTPNGKAIVCAMPDHSLVSFDAVSGGELWRIGGMGYVVDFVLTPDGKTLLVSDTSGLRVWDVATRREMRAIDKSAARLALDGDLVATAGGYETTVPIINWKTGEVVRMLETFGQVEHTAPLFLSDNRLAVVSQYDDHAIQIFDH